MIATLQGDVLEKEADRLVILVHGIGFEVLAPYSTIEKVTVGEHLLLNARLVIGKDSLALCGFATRSERDLFDALLKVSRIGPRLAVTILSTLSVENIHEAVRNNRPEIISRVPGISKKGAQRIVVELQDKIPSALEVVPLGADGDTSAEVMDALTALGYSVVEAQTAIQSIPMDAPQSVEERVLIALQSLGG